MISGLRPELDRATRIDPPRGPGLADGKPGPRVRATGRQLAGGAADRPGIGRRPTTPRTPHAHGRAQRRSEAATPPPPRLLRPQDAPLASTSESPSLPFRSFTSS